MDDWKDVRQYAKVVAVGLAAAALIMWFCWKVL